MPPGGTDARERPKLAQKRAHSVRNSRAMADSRLSLRSLVALCTMPPERLQALARLLELIAPDEVVTLPLQHVVHQIDDVESVGGRCELHHFPPYTPRDGARLPSRAQAH